MMRKQSLAASVVIPLCLALTALAVFLLALLEGARHFGLKADAKEWTNLTAESLFAAYQPFLFEEYGLFFLDGGFGKGKLSLSRAEGEMEALLCDNFALEGVNLYRMGVAGVNVSEVQLAADDDGAVFAAYAANVMKKEIGVRAAKKILSEIKRIDEKGEGSINPEDAMKDANHAIEEARQAQEEAAKDEKAEDRDGDASPPPERPVQPPAENPLEIVKRLREKGILALTLPEGKSLSGRKAPEGKRLLERDLARGNFKKKEKAGWYERILMQEYLKPLIGNAVTPKVGGALSYGVEYLICGKKSDEENLKGTVRKLLLLREVMNFLYLQGDHAKQAEALSAASAIAGITGNPAIISLVKQGILAAWAYVESIYDVKELLNGGKVPLTKNASQWKSSLSNFGAGEGSGTANSASGLTYERYLDALLYAKSVKQAAYRAMDLMEWDLQNEKGFAKCKMDQMAVGMKIEAEYNADTLFLGIFSKDGIGGYTFLETAEYAYGK